MPTEADDSTKSVALALQRVFHDLQFLDKVRNCKIISGKFPYTSQGQTFPQIGGGLCSVSQKLELLSLPFIF